MLRLLRQQLRISLALASSLLIAACAARTEPIVQDDQFSPNITILGVPQMENPFGGTGKHWMIKSFINKQTGTETDQLYIMFMYSFGWRFYEAAADDHAQPLSLRVLGREVEDCNAMSCIYSETVGVMLPDGYLDQRSEGFQVKIQARSGDSQIIQISPDQISKQRGLTAKYKTAGGFPPRNDEPKASTAP